MAPGREPRHGRAPTKTKMGGGHGDSVIPPWPPQPAGCHPACGARRHAGDPRASRSCSRLRAWQRLQPPQPAQPPGCRDAAPAGPGHAALDLLTEEEASDRRKVFDISLLGRRLEAAGDIAGEAATAGMPVRVFGASTGAAAALVAAAGQPATVGAVVSRGGRPDLAGEMQLRNVVAPTLLIVGGEDRQVLDLNAMGTILDALPDRTRHRARRDASVRGGRRAGTGGPAGGRLVPPLARDGGRAC